MKVRQSMSPAHAEVLSRADAAIATSPHLDRRSVKLSIVGDSIEIHGSVASYFEKQMAQEALRSVVAPLRIENNLLVSW